MLSKLKEQKTLIAEHNTVINDRMSGFDCEILLIANCEFFHNSQSKESQKKKTQLIMACPHGNLQSLESQSGLYSTISNRLTTQSKPDLRYPVLYLSRRLYGYGSMYARVCYVSSALLVSMCTQMYTNPAGLLYLCPLNYELSVHVKRTKCSVASCSSSEYKYYLCGHVLTGDLSIIRDVKLRNLIRKVLFLESKIILIGRLI